MKLNSFSAVLSTIALAGGVWLGASNTAEACALSKFKETTSSTSGNSPTLTTSQLNFNKVDLFAAGGAAVAGLLT